MSSISLTSDNATANAMFSWAFAKARSQRIDGLQQGPLDVSERDPAGLSVGTYEDCYRAGYRHRSAFYLRDFAHQAVGAHLLGWDTRNRGMFDAFANSLANERAGWPYWAINFDRRTPFALDYESSDRFVRELPAIFELVETAHVLYRWTGDPRYVSHAERLRRVCEEFVEANQGALRNGVAAAEGAWIFDGVPSYNELRGLVLREAGDGFASQFAATRHAAELLAAAGDDASANRLLRRAEGLHAYYSSSWSRGEAEDIVSAWTVDGAAVGGWAYEASIFPLLKGLLVDSRSYDALSKLDESCTDDILAPQNLEALTYLPDVFFRHHQPDLAWTWMQRVFSQREMPHVVPEQGSNADYPEISFTLLSQLTQGLLGLEPEATHNRMILRPSLPAGIRHLDVTGIPFGDGTVCVSLSHDACTVTNRTARSLHFGLTRSSGYRDPHLLGEVEYTTEIQPGLTYQLD